jgi:hypothetical protein
MSEGQAAAVGGDVGGAQTAGGELAGGANAGAATGAVAGQSAGAVLSGATDTQTAGGSGQSAESAADTGAEGWYGSFNDDLKGYAAKKGWRGPESVVESYRNLEKLIGVKDRLVTLPDSVEDADAWNDVYNKLGRPESHDKYELKLPEEFNDDFVGWAKESFHETGLTQRQAEVLSSKWNDYVQAQEEASRAAQESERSAQMDKLRSEWGVAYDKYVNQAKQAVAALGVDAKQVDALESVMGYDGVLKFFQGIGAKTMESSFVKPDSPKGFDGPLSPVDAQRELANLKADKAWVQRYLQGDRAAREQSKKLHQWAFPGTPV